MKQDQSKVKSLQEEWIVIVDGGESQGISIPRRFSTDQQIYHAIIYDYMDGLPWGNGRAGTDRSNLVQAGDIVLLRVREDFKGSRLGFYLQWLHFTLWEETWQGKKHVGKFYAELRWFLSNMQVQSRAETIPLPLEKSGFQEVSAKLLRAAIVRINCYRIHLPQNGPLPYSVNTPLIGIITSVMTPFI